MSSFFISLLLMKITFSNHEYLQTEVETCPPLSKKKANMTPLQKPLIRKIKNSLYCKYNVNLVFDFIFNFYH